MTQEEKIKEMGQCNHYIAFTWLNQNGKNINYEICMLCHKVTSIDIDEYMNVELNRKMEAVARKAWRLGKFGTIHGSNETLDKHMEEDLESLLNGKKDDDS